MATLDRETTHSGTAAAPPLGGDAARAGEDWLARRYEEYRRRQGTALLALIPRDGIRPLYRAALERTEGPSDGGDTLAFLADFAAELLPLPPFDVWCRDFREHRADHLAEAEEAGSPTATAGPVTVEVRPFDDPTGVTWYASLDVERVHGRWSGRIVFHPEGGGRTVRTGDVFREDDAASIRGRFLEFGTPTLQAFLRSVLP